MVVNSGAGGSSHFSIFFLVLHSAGLFQGLDSEVTGGSLPNVHSETDTLASIIPSVVYPMSKAMNLSMTALARASSGQESLHHVADYRSSPLEMSRMQHVDSG